MNHMKATAILVACGLAAAAAARGTVEYCFMASDTGNGDGTLEPGEAAVITLVATVDPDQSANGGGFAGSIFDVVGVTNWDTGRVTDFQFVGDFADMSIPGEVQANNDITGIETFRLPSAFDPDFDFSNPVVLAWIEWAPDDYTRRTVQVTEANHLNNSVYTDEFGTNVEFQATSCRLLNIPIVPAPGSVALLGLGGLMAARRRR